MLLLERTKLVVEGAGAVGVAALLSGKVGGSGCVVPVLSGGNIDATLLISVMRHGLAVAGRYLVVRIARAGPARASSRSCSRCSRRSA